MMAKRLKEVVCKAYSSSDVIYVWADDDVMKQVNKMDAVTGVRDGANGSQVFDVDPRYDIFSVAKEIEALGGASPQPSMLSFLYKVMKAQPLV